MDVNERLLTRYYMRTNPAGFDSDDDGNLIDPLEEAAQIGGTESRDIGEDIETLGEVLPDVAQGALSGTAKGFHQINKLDPTGILPAIEAFGGRIAKFLGIDTGIDEPKTIPGKLAEGFGQFLPGIIPAVRAARYAIGTSTFLRNLAAEVVGGVIGDFATSGEDEAEGIVQLIQLANQEQLNVLADTLEEFIDDPEGIGSKDFRQRVVGALPGAVLAPPIEGLIRFTQAALKTGRASALANAIGEIAVSR